MAHGGHPTSAELAVGGEGLVQGLGERLRSLGMGVSLWSRLGVILQ